MRWDVHNRLYHENLNSYYPVVQWTTVRLMLIYQCILFFHSQRFDSKNNFSRADIPSGEPLLIEINRDLKSDGEQHDVFLRLEKSLYG